MTAPALAHDTEHGRYYTRPDGNKSVPSITNITSMKAKPLFGSGLKAAARYAAANREMLVHVDEAAAYKLVSDPPYDPLGPAAIGDIVHAWIERHIKGDAPSHEEVKTGPQTAQWMFDRYRRFIEKYNPEFTGSEFTVWSDKYGYAGTADWSARINGKHVLADSKSGKGVYPEVAMQLAAIQNADFILDADGREHPLPKYDRYAVLHLRPRSYALHPVEYIDEAFKSFLGLKQVFDWHVRYAPYSIRFVPKQTS